MSEQDQKIYGDVARRFIGESMHVGVAANSLKLVPKTADGSNKYIWVDPPWSLWRNGEQVASGADCPEPGDVAYEAKFKVFCDAVAVLRGATLEAITFRPDGTAEFSFGTSLHLLVWHQEPRDEEERRRYDDWHAKDSD